jgi:hypothetical protein
VGKVLVVGVGMLDVPNHTEHVVAQFSRSAEWNVTQRWIGLGTSPVPAALHQVMPVSTNERQPKFVFLNSMFREIAPGDHEYLIVCDDDILLPDGFLDRFLALVQRYDLALSQPARTHDSYIDHPFVEQLDGLEARRTRFVEIGPVFCIRRDAMPLLLPFDESSPMGWGYDFTWPCVMESAGLRTGIVDATPVSHSLRKSVTHYTHSSADQAMREYLARQPHLARNDAFLIVEAYARD